MGGRVFRRLFYLTYQIVIAAHPLKIRVSERVQL